VRLEGLGQFKNPMTSSGFEIWRIDVLKMNCRGLSYESNPQGYSTQVVLKVILAAFHASWLYNKMRMGKKVLVFYCRNFILSNLGIHIKCCRSFQWIGKY
jgi:hypothetical protein